MIRWLKDFIASGLSWDKTAFPALIDLSWRLIFLGIGALGTIWIAPIISQDFEAEKRKTIYYSESIKLLSGDTKEFLADITEVTYLEDPSEINKSNLTDIRKKITVLHWRAVEILLVNNNDPALKILVSEYQLALDALSTVFSERIHITNQELYPAIDEFTESTSKIILYLAKLADG